MKAIMRLCASSRARGPAAPTSSSTKRAYRAFRHRSESLRIVSRAG